MQREDGNKNLSEREGVIDRVVYQGEEWRVRVNGVYWSARALKKTEFLPGDRFRVIGRQHQKLLIEAVSPR